MVSTFQFNIRSSVHQLSVNSGTCVLHLIIDVIFFYEPKLQSYLKYIAIEKVKPHLRWPLNNQCARLFEIVISRTVISGTFPHMMLCSRNDCCVLGMIIIVLRAINLHFFKKKIDKSFVIF